MIKKALSGIFILAAAAIAAGQPASAPATSTQPPPQAAQPKPTPMVPHTNLKVGQEAPDFTLPSTIASADGRSVMRYKLSDFRGKKNVVLAFYVLAFTGG